MGQKAKGERSFTGYSSYFVLASWRVRFRRFCARRVASIKWLFETEEGKALRDAYSEAEWKRTAFGETIYTPPFRSGEGELYCFVNNKYIGDIETTFDGTYQSLKKILALHSDSDLHIGAVNMTDELATIWMGYQLAGIKTYEPGWVKMVDITRQPQAKEMLKLLYSDIQSGTLIINPKPENIKQELLVYVTRKFYPEMEGYTAYRISPDSNTGFDFFGISKYSSNKELAFQVLSAVYCDPRIASLINFRRTEPDPEGWVWQASYIKNSLDPKPVMGFVADLTLEQREALNEYYHTISPLFYMINISGGKSEIIQNYLEELDAVFDNPKDYGDVFETVNAQLEEWLKDHKE